ncbi:LOW QUALITY PROTEIN: tigger transposable element-derived 4-like protein [Plakobranchus ocellatus]|uniref:Tigger transposable element-derived 4-like protein n=1 Tax=Plakobranchus ocellatus TaxID=259542 RepID=A0AAV3YVH9_9GAST|nr:LOW QUALITY PROTEIN: tigger transposable element-derived 4-like protein [Plakobranchus ocellatus]
MDNHESHVSRAAREYAKENNIHTVTLLPHTSHRTQPLDRTVFGPMMIFLNSACDSWCLAYPRRAISIYDMAGLIREAWMKASTPNNITAGFKVSRVWHLDKHGFGNENYLPSRVTDRPLPEPISDQHMSSNPVTDSDLPTAAANPEPGPPNSSAPDSPLLTAAANREPGPSNSSAPDSPLPTAAASPEPGSFNSSAPDSPLPTAAANREPGSSNSSALPTAVASCDSGSPNSSAPDSALPTAVASCDSGPTNSSAPDSALPTAAASCDYSSAPDSALPTAAASCDSGSPNSAAPDSALPTAAASCDSGSPNSSAPDSAVPISIAASRSAFSKSPSDVVGYPKANIILCLSCHLFLFPCHPLLLLSV